MEEHKPRNAFDIPKLFYFEAGNLHTGSRGALRYRILPAAPQLYVEVWCKDLCYELVQDAIEAAGDFPLTETGFQQMLDFLQAEYEKANGRCTKHDLDPLHPSNSFQDDVKMSDYKAPYV